MTAVLRTFVLVAGLWLPFSIQERDPGRNAPGGRLAGRVIAADTGQPVGGARITITSVAPGQGEVTVADSFGAFEVGGLRAGPFVVVASKPGLYLDTGFGQTEAGSPQQVVQIVEGRTASIDIRMLRGGVIAGRVFDESGEPIPLVEVSAERPGQTTGKMRRTSSAGTRYFDGADFTNDRGEYRIFGLPPGEYLVYATPPQMFGSSVTFLMRAPPVDRASTPAARLPQKPVRYAPVYFPGVIDLTAASRLQLSAGQEIPNVDFTLRLTRTVLVSGIAVDPDGEPLRGGSLALHVADGSGEREPSQIASIRADGSFAFDGLPGQYILRARYVLPDASPSSGWKSLSVAVPLRIGENEISGLLLKLTRGAAVRGRFVFEGSGTIPNPAAFKVAIETGGLGAVQSAKGGAEGTFELEGIESGLRRITASGPPGWTLKGIHVNGREVADVPVEFRDDIPMSDVSVIFTDVRSPLTVQVDYSSGSSSCVVIVFPEDRTHWPGRRTQLRATSADSVVIEGLPAGDYLAVALADVVLSSISTNDSKLLDRLVPLAQKVQLMEGTPKAVRVRGVPFPR